MGLDLEKETIRRDLRIVHMGSAGRELRLVLADRIGADSSLVVVLEGVHSFFDRGAIGSGVVLARVQEPGSFAWRFSDAEGLGTRRFISILSLTRRRTFSAPLRRR